VNYKEFHSKREQLKAAMSQWTQDLDPDNTREFQTLPEAANAMQDDYSTGKTLFFVQTLRL
jgi:DNA primase